MLSLLSTHVILHYHRQVHYHGTATDESESTEAATKRWGSTMRDRGGMSFKFMAATGVALPVAVGLYLTGVLLETFEVTNTRGPASFVDKYSIVLVGQNIPEANLDESSFGTRFLQAMWFFLGVAMPIWCSFLFLILFFAPLSARWMIRIFTMAEIALAWSATQVLIVSTLFAVLQMPTFGEGLINADCSACFVVSTRILPNFAFLAVGGAMIVGTNVFLYRKAHYILYKE
jgi:hypothetical protein